MGASGSGFYWGPPCCAYPHTHKRSTITHAWFGKCMPTVEPIAELSKVRRTQTLASFYVEEHFTTATAGHTLEEAQLMFVGRLLTLLGQLGGPNGEKPVSLVASLFSINIDRRWGRLFSGRDVFRAIIVVGFYWVVNFGVCVEKNVKCWWK